MTYEPETTVFISDMQSPMFGLTATIIDILDNGYVINIESINGPVRRFVPFTSVSLPHQTRGGYGPHDWDCPACVEEADRRKAWREDPANNPHRAGTKAAAEWLRSRAQVDLAMDLRSETYWSM